MDKLIEEKIKERVRIKLEKREIIFSKISSIINLLIGIIGFTIAYKVFFAS